ncbi:MAG: hypothetical protein H6910_03370 [Rickettsiaceae bacterium]|nr:hypothetical protein [Rickettsiaceae bacterium]MCP5378138.1 hypothetical protein [Rickettsiaceae bacterium]
MILLIRHCTPNIDYNKCNYEEALVRLYEYNTTKNIKIEEITDIKDNIQHIVNLDKIKVLCSTSPRASITADNLFSKSVEITRSDKFVEFDLSIFYVPFLICSIRTWFLISRLLWFVGILKTDRNFKQECERADNCAKLLTREAATTDVALVAHGLLHLFIEKRLKKMGWRRTHAFSSGCFSTKVLQNA